MKPPLNFPRTDVPILGQPITLKSWFATALIACNCGATPEPILIVGQSPSPCPSCHKAYIINAITFTWGQPPTLGIGIVTGSVAPS